MRDASKMIAVKRLVRGIYSATDKNGGEWTLYRSGSTGKWEASRKADPKDVTEGFASLAALREELWASCLFPDVTVEAR